MSKSKTIRLLITTGNDEEVLAVLVRERHPNQFGEVVPPVVVEHEHKDYILKRKMMQDVYVYSPSIKKGIDDFLAPPPIR